MVQWNSYSQNPDVLSSIQGLRKLVRADSLSLSLFFFFFWLQNIIMYTALPWFSFSLFYILLFSVHIVNVNAAKSGTVSWHVLIGFLSQAVGLFTINECE